MPLYTYVTAYKGATYVAQGRHSNFKGFVSTWAAGIPKDVLPGLTSDLRKELSDKSYQGTFEEVPNRRHVWRKSLTIGGSDFVVIAIQADA
jgi:hypothetical protein